ncbi:lytic transglycosylase domain-containing protein [Saccharopolyspora hirsuta]|uniref:Lytic transglycosylase domain-containing protein n=2 Tax=Saccharopolyspora hirsuta TaxID=1837 RepID=A0A5M7CCD8_SACHI|nr:lytic transglycosylase domain-containing protein [Saccharopolyspora hirsuta]
MWKTAPRFGGVAGHRARRWVAVTALTPALLLPLTLVGASSSFLAAPQGPPRSDPRELGVTGHLPQAPQPGQELLGQAGDPRELAEGAERPIELPTGALGIPEVALTAYRQAADAANERNPNCGLHWSVLASIGRIESGHARSGSVDLLGTTVRAILGPRLSGGPGVAAIPDTDGGTFDGDPVWDRAVGPMQFIPSTWRKFAVDGNADGAASPHNIHDAAAAAGQYLCSGAGDLREPRDLAAAVFRYNHSESYVRTVLIWAAAYAKGVTPTPTELAPEVDDVLAGERLPDGPAVLAMPAAPVAAPPAPAPPPSAQPVPSGEPPAPSAEVPPQPGGALPHPGEVSVAPPTIPEPTPPNLTPGPTAPGTSAPPSSAPSTPGAPPSTTGPGVPPPPPPTGTPGTPPPEAKPEPGAPSPTPAPPSTTPPPEPGTPSPTPAPPSETPPPGPGAPPSETPSGVAPTPPSVTAPPVTLPETGDPAPAPVEALGTCDPAVLGRGEFSPEQPAPGTAIGPGTGDPSALVPGQEVYVQNGAPGTFATCTTGIPTPPR